jgi:hypothetical protein
MGHDPDCADLGVSGRGTLSLRVLGEGISLSAGVRAAMDRAINSILDRAYSKAREALLAEMKRLTRVAAFLYEHERIDGAQFQALFDGTLAPSAGVETEWRSAKSKPRSWNEIGGLIAAAASSGSAAGMAPSRVVNITATPVSAGRWSARSRRAGSLAARVFLGSWWQRARRAVDPPVE